MTVKTEVQLVKLVYHREGEYHLSDENRAELKRVFARIFGRKVTGKLTVDLADGGVNSFKVFEVVKQTK